MKKGSAKLGLAIQITAICCALMIGASGCTRKSGPFERAGERADEMVDNVRDGENPLKHKGPAEKAGEAVDDALDGRANNR